MTERTEFLPRAPCPGAHALYVRHRVVVVAGARRETFDGWACTRCPFRTRP